MPHVCLCICACVCIHNKLAYTITYFTQIYDYLQAGRQTDKKARNPGVHLGFGVQFTGFFDQTAREAREERREREKQSRRVVVLGI